MIQKLSFPGSDEFPTLLSPGRGMKVAKDGLPGSVYAIATKGALIPRFIPRDVGSGVTIASTGIPWSHLEEIRDKIRRTDCYPDGPSSLHLMNHNGNTAAVLRTGSVSSRGVLEGLSRIAANAKKYWRHPHLPFLPDTLEDHLRVAMSQLQGAIVNGTVIREKFICEYILNGAPPVSICSCITSNCRLENIDGQNYFIYRSKMTRTAVGKTPDKQIVLGTYCIRSGNETRDVVSPSSALLIEGTGNSGPDNLYSSEAFIPEGMKVEEFCGLPSSFSTTNILMESIHIWP